ncbi:unnamed protein product [Peniophora sp. CBMAI 1063]|nr:unnamed protein product [Peniophora sp. CBMAI 1063]
MPDLVAFFIKIITTLILHAYSQLSQAAYRLASLSRDRLPGADPIPKRHPSLPPIHALIIGINTYRSDLITDLRGAVNDADAMNDYLRKELHVPANQIVNLRNKQATRKAIIRELRAFRKRETIQKGDPILIYFAGHGSTSSVPDGWAAANGKISLLMPYDSLSRKVYGATIQPIPDRTIGAILHDLAEGGKGNNVTVILDCCHSGSGTRDLDPKAPLRERGIVLDEKYKLPSNLDVGIWNETSKDRAVSVAEGFSLSGTKSHVLLAACRESEKAKEDEDGGVFTRSLLNALRTLELHKTTYQDLMEQIINVPGQTPQCEGHYSDRILFNALVKSKKSLVYPVTSEGQKVIMAAGAIHGVTEGCLYSIYTSRHSAPDSEPLAVMSASSVGPFRTELSCSDAARALAITWPSSCFAFQRTRSDGQAVRLYVPHGDSIPPVMEALQEMHELQQQTLSFALLTGNENEAHFGVRLDGHRIKYPICDPLVTSYGLHAFYQTTKARSRYVYPILRAGIHFFWHLHHGPKKHQLLDHIQPQMYELELDEDGELGLDLRRPYTTSGGSLLQSGRVDITVTDQDRSVYGIAVHNRLKVPLHVWAFYFDCSDLSINEYHRPTAVGRGADASLPAEGSLTIGYGDGGGRPFTYFLRPEQDVDVGFIKLYISTHFVDLSHIEQESPFEVGMPRGSEMTVEHFEGAWDTVLIPVVQHR